MGATYFDRSYWDPSASSDRYRLFVPFLGNVVLDATPAVGNSDTHVLR